MISSFYLILDINITLEKWKKVACSMQNKAVNFSLAAVAAFFLAAVGLAIAMPWLTEWYVRYRLIQESGRIALLVSFYGCLPFALAVLICLWRLLRNIRADRIFVAENSRMLAAVSWCCAAAAAVTLGTCRWYPPLGFLTVSAAFIFLIVRVVRNCFIAAIALKEENRLTI